MKKTEIPYWVNWLVRDENNRLWGFPKKPVMKYGQWTQEKYEGTERPYIIDELDNTYSVLKQNMVTEWTTEFGKKSFIPIVQPRDRETMREIPIYILLDTSMRVKEKVVVVFTDTDLSKILNVKAKYIERNSVDLTGFETMLKIERSSIYIEEE